MKDLAREVVLSFTAMSRFVDRVEAAGHVRRLPDPDDRRALRIELTESGEELLRRMWPVCRRGIEEHFTAHLGPVPGHVATGLERVAAAARRDADAGR